MGALNWRDSLQGNRYVGCGVWRRSQQAHSSYTSELPGCLQQSSTKYPSYRSTSFCILTVVDYSFLCHCIDNVTIVTYFEVLALLL